MLGLVVATIVTALLGRPKKPGKGNAAEEAGKQADPLGDVAEPSLDFGDELSQMNNK